ncbi:formate/nitrite transporter family protein [Ornithinimicrobium cryptoxanthini]|uniref:Formate/nitrite transporter family protein n=1 Tax=Ornithinimicrobium cryptoxanthini TaxID=2934161 RepID=A0ABY4YE71_9MICO|nr:formate/nitrite transporter family protein [Ornithinimicrobium cryptoxanthini]USQ74850.1 formate/nitrite transporter family protein [Ornithinimicrobium cryptoxanthini]
MSEKPGQQTDDQVAEDSDGQVDPAAARVEEEVRESFDRTVEKGAERLHRGWRVLITTGLFGGLEVGLGILAYLAVLHQTDNHLLAGLAFGIGLVALYLAHSELFTEGFLLPIMALFARRGTVLQLLRLWGMTLVTNLVGGWVFMWFVAHAFPEFAGLLTETARHFVDAPLGLRAVALSVLGGIVITVLTRMQEGTDSDGVKVVAAFSVGFLLAGLSLFHSVLDSIIIFGAIHAEGSVSYGEWLAWFWYVVPLNMLGGLVFVTAMRLVRASELPEAPGPDNRVDEASEAS